MFRGFEMTDNEIMFDFLGIQAHHMVEGIFISQNEYMG